MDLDPQVPSSNPSSDLFGSDDTDFLEALCNTVLPGDIQAPEPSLKRPRSPQPEPTAQSQVLPPLPKADHNSLEPQADQDIYGPSRFGQYGEYMRRKRAKLQIQNTHLDQDGADDGSGSGSQIFRGVAIYINGWTEPSVQELRQLIVRHGGVFHPYLDTLSLVTHIVTNHLTPAKIKEFQHRKVVRPEWLLESVKQGVLLPWTDFIWKPDEKAEPTQGMKSKQRDLADNFLVETHRPKAAPSSPSKAKHVPPHATEISLQPSDSSPVSPPSSPKTPHYAAHDSNPNARRAMADPSWRAMHTSMAPDFIEGYYKNSRLHYLSMWKAELRGLVAEAIERAEHGEGEGGSNTWKTHGDDGGGVSMLGAELTLRSPSKGKGKVKATNAGSTESPRIIMHCDFDCFFASVGLVSRPHLRGKPVVVCHSQGSTGGGTSTSEIASSSYEAREFGIRNGMSLQQARKLCPDIITIPYEFEQYKRCSIKFYTILMAHADDVQAVSVDEALIETTSSVARYKTEHPESTSPAKDFAELLREKVRSETGCEVSVGISHNILLARLATRRAKPAGSFHLLQPEVSSFLADLDIKDLHGFGWSAHKKAREKLGTTILGELAKKSKSILSEALGRGTGETLWKAVRGIDDKKLESDKPRKSVSCDITYGVRFENDEQVEAFVCRLAEEVAKRLSAIDMRGRSLTLKVMKRDPSAPAEAAKFLGHGRCDTYVKQAILAGPGGRATSDNTIIGERAWQLLKAFRFDPKELRGIGIQITKLERGSTGSGESDRGQGLLLFKSVNNLGQTKAVGEERPSITIQSSSPIDDNAIDANFDAGHLPAAAFELPSLSQVDMDVLEALPADLRREVEAEIQLRSHSPVPGPSNISAPITPVKTEGTSKLKSTNTGTAKGKEKERQPNLKRITQQLAPRNRPIITSQKCAFFEKRETDVPKFTATDAELRKLDIDPSVFAMLPVELQKEQLTMARRAWNAGGTAQFIGQRKPIKPYQRLSRSPSVPFLRRPLPKAKFLPRPTLKQQRKGKGERIHFSETEDVQNLIEKWVMGFRAHPPNEKDVRYFEKYLVECIQLGGDAGIERAIKVAKWWLFLLRRHWGDWEDKAEDEDKKKSVGNGWWTAFREVKEKMDIAARQRFGGTLSLR